MMDQQNSRRIVHDYEIEQQIQRNNIAAAITLGSGKGILILSVHDAVIQVQSYQESYAIDDLLVDITNPYRLFSSWITYDPDKDYLSYNEKNFCEAFVNSHKLTQKKGRFYADGKHVSMVTIEQMIYNCLSLVTNKAGEKKRSVLSALKTNCPDESPQETRETDRLTIKA